MPDEPNIGAPCTCGRSTTGNCLGWHNLTNEEYERVRMEAELKLDEERRVRLLTEGE